MAVSVVSKFMHAPTQDHLEVAYKVLKYLKGCPGTGILYRKFGHTQVEIYADVDWVGSLTGRKSTSGYCSLVGGNLLTWRSKKQSVVAR